MKWSLIAMLLVASSCTPSSARQSTIGSVTQYTVNNTPVIVEYSGDDPGGCPNEGAFMGEIIAPVVEFMRVKYAEQLGPEFGVHIMNFDDPSYDDSANEVSTLPGPGSLYFVPLSGSSGLALNSLEGPGLGLCLRVSVGTAIRVRVFLIGEVVQ